MKYSLKENFRFLYADGQLYDEDGDVAYTYENSTLFFPQINLYREDFLLGYVKKNFTWFLRNYDIYFNDELVDSLDQKFTFFRSELELERLGWKIKGDFFSWHYQIYDENDEMIAQVDQEIFRFTQRFYIDIYDEENEVLIILLVLAINQFDKDVAASSAASSSHSSASHN